LKDMRTVSWDPEAPALILIDQRLLPVEFTLIRIETVDAVVAAIRDMVVRGAPAIGVTAAYGLALAGLRSGASSRQAFLAEMEQAAELLRSARPTASNLSWAIDGTLSVLKANQAQAVDELQATLLEEAERLAEADIATNRRMARFGADLLENGDTVIHHCNTGSLATVEYGTALGVVRWAHEQGKRIHVLVDETRPRLQGARLTAWELEQLGVSYELIVDGAAGSFMQKGSVDAVLVGADRVAANGDVANKIGTYMLALAAHDQHVPFYCVLPTSTIDLSLQSGDEIQIEEREPGEVLSLRHNERALAPATARARNPAFDITPARLVTAFVTEVGVLRPPFRDSLSQALEKASP
jgi:methylthioribose-1-phosphate isomerase